MYCALNDVTICANYSVSGWTRNNSGCDKNMVFYASINTRRNLVSKHGPTRAYLAQVRYLTATPGS